MQTKHTTPAQTMEELQQAAHHLAIGFERAKTLSRQQQADAMREASAALIEMRRAADDLAKRLK